MNSSCARLSAIKHSFLCTFSLLQAAMGFHEHGPLGFQLTTDGGRGHGGGGATAAPWWAAAQGQGCAASKFPISSGEWKLKLLTFLIATATMDGSIDGSVAWDKTFAMVIH